MFKLNKKLSEDCIKISSFDKSELLLMNNKEFYWLILVPRVENIVEFTDLSFVDQIEILKEINVVSKILQEHFKPDKINIAMLGNVVSQLHIHVIARFKTDIAFPKPAFGFLGDKFSQNEINKIKKIFDVK